MASEQRPVIDVETLLCRSAAVFAASAGVIHLAAAGDHREHPVAAVSFVVVGCLQFAWAGLIVRRPSRRLLLAGALGSLIVLALWIQSRTAGIPVAFGGEGVETMGVPDTLASFLELLVASVAAMVAILPSEAAPSRPGRCDRRTGHRRGRRRGVAVARSHAGGADQDHGHGHDGLEAAAVRHGHDAGSTGHDAGSAGHGTSDAHGAAAPTHAHTGSAAMVAGVRHAHADAVLRRRARARHRARRQSPTALGRLTRTRTVRARPATGTADLPTLSRPTGRGRRTGGGHRPGAREVRRQLRCHGRRL